ncbi:MAG: hypothetical protein Q8M76_16900, partial [Spirochaetaceae bacterium]|nr:hypothetical protein [Spirochaetaceae bacterium]
MRAGAAAGGAEVAPRGPFARLSGGSIGGKGQGLELLASLFSPQADSVRGLRIAVPRTATIGLDAFEAFMESNLLRGKARRQEGCGDWG